MTVFDRKGEKDKPCLRMVFQNPRQSIKESGTPSQLASPLAYRAMAASTKLTSSKSKPGLTRVFVGKEFKLQNSTTSGDTLCIAIEQRISIDFHNSIGS
jgi:hypothetical protein